MSGRITAQVRDFLIGRGPASPERVAEAVPELMESGGAERALLMMRLDPLLERTSAGLWAARALALTDERRVRGAAEKFLGTRPGAPLSSATQAVMSTTHLAEHRVRELLEAQFVVVGTNIYNRRR